VWASAEDASGRPSIPWIRLCCAVPCAVLSALWTVLAGIDSGDAILAAWR
jgi:hypothetical protein